jgi:hypothetical protein
MKNSFPLLIFSFLLLGCSDDKSLEFTTTKIEKSSNIAQDEWQTKVLIELPQVTSEDIVADSINAALYAFAEEVINLEEKNIDNPTFEGLADSFINSYLELKKEFPKEIAWEAKINGLVVYQSPKIINIRVEYYMFTGGAHGYYGVKSLIFDAQTGKILSNKDVFAPYDEFTSYVEEKFRTKFGLAPNQNINAKGFMFEEDKFILPENIFFTKNGVLLVYNIYEIAPYSDGTQELLLPLKEVKSFLKIDIDNQ